MPNAVASTKKRMTLLSCQTEIMCRTSIALNRASILRKIMSRGKEVRRVMVFHAFASHGERAAAAFARLEDWEVAFAHVKRTNPALCRGWTMDDFEIYSAIGGGSADAGPLQTADAAAASDAIKASLRGGCKMECLAALKGLLPSDACDSEPCALLAGQRRALGS